MILDICVDMYRHIRMEKLSYFPFVPLEKQDIDAHVILMNGFYTIDRTNC